MTKKILITGATGNVGTEVVRNMRDKSSIRIAVLDVPKARTALGDDLDYVYFDFLKPETFANAFSGIDRVFLVRPPALSNVQRDIAPSIQAAREAGVKQVVFLSLQGVEQNWITPHYKIEQLLRNSGMGWTFLRASFFMQNLSTTHRDEIRESDAIMVPVGKAKTSFIDVRDIGAVAARVLSEEGHENRAYTLTGGETLDYFQAAETMSLILDRRIRYANPSVVGFIWRQIARGRPLGFTLVMTMLYTLTRFGNAAEVTSDVHTILQRPPIRFQQYVQDYRHCWT